MALTDYIKRQADAIRTKDGTTDPIPFVDFEDRILAIPSGGGGGGGWQPPTDWWDIKTMVDTGVLEWSGASVANVRYGYVVSDGYPTTKLVAGYEYYLSDGSYYNGSAEVVHTWARSKDKPCSEGYMTRAVIVVKAANRDVAVQQRSLSLDGIASLYIYLGDCNVTSIVASDDTWENMNFALRAVLSDKITTASGSALGDFAFRYCAALALIEIPQGVTSIGNNAFNDCHNLTAVTIPQSVTSISDGAFSYCAALASIEIPQGVTSISDWMFNGCSALTVVEIPQSVTSIGNNAFNDCHNLTAFNVPVGFSLSIDLSYSPLLSVTSLEQLIDNAADMTEQTAITFTLGTDNLAKLTNEYKALAAAKNITLA